MILKQRYICIYMKCILKFNPFCECIFQIEIKRYNLEIWPGYNTSIRQHEKDVLLNIDFLHKVLRKDSVYRILQNCIAETNDFQTAFRKEMTGKISKYSCIYLKIDSYLFDV